MDVNDLKSNWKNSSSEKKTPEELLAMTRIQNHPTLKRIRLKLIIEVALLLSFLSVYSNIFDGENKPTWINLLLISCGALYILTDFVGYLTLQNPIKGDNIKLSLEAFKSKLNRMAVFSVIASILFGTSLLLFFSSTIDFTLEKYLILGGMLITMFILIYFSYKNWQSRIQQIGEVEAGFGEEG